MIVYNWVMQLFSWFIAIIACFNKGKLNLFHKGRIGLISQINKDLYDYKGKTAWIHCASLGEFEQGRPVIEEIRKRHPDFKLVLTFFSPSGYEVQKSYEGVDHIYYMPIDTKRNAQLFLNAVRPDIIYFVKYEFWLNHLEEIRKRNIPIYLFSAIFDSQQVFFKWYGTLFRKALQVFSHIFVQDENSRNLLNSIGYTRVTVTGDTRFDRVYRIAQQSKVFPEIKNYIKDDFCLICGSTWPDDENIIVRFINESILPIKYILAPHEVDEDHVTKITNSIHKPWIRYTQIQNKSLDDYSVLVIDNVGMLAALYKYGNIAYVGGGFGKDGIHNCLEPATFGIPVVFGPNYQRYIEAIGLVKQGGAFSVKTYNEFTNCVNQFFSNKAKRVEAGNKASAFIQSGLGASEKIISQSY